MRNTNQKMCSSREMDHSIEGRGLVHFEALSYPMRTNSLFEVSHPLVADYLPQCYITRSFTRLTRAP